MPAPKRRKAKPSLRHRITWLFKPWIVNRRKGQCQVLFALTELDGLVDQIIHEVFQTPIEEQGNAST